MALMAMSPRLLPLALAEALMALAEAPRLALPPLAVAIPPRLLPLALAVAMMAL